MYTLTGRSQAIALAFSLFALTVTPLPADDTEVYLGDLAFSTSIRPNVLFIMDTSASMDTDVILTTGSYDSGTTYSGPCNPGHVYWTAASAGGAPPGCATGNYLAAAANQCADSQAALSTGTSGGPGYYTGTLARYHVRATREDRWEKLSGLDHAGIIDCQADYGIHGDGGAGGGYPADENDGGPYNTTPASAINWNTTGGVYTLYSANYLNWLHSPGSAT
ncbi:MAG: hypothetical protein PVI50_04310, partial [Gammaproteobacteria bacterium]